MVELCKKRHKGQFFPAGQCLKNPEDKVKARGRTNHYFKPFYSVWNFGVLETLVLLQFFLENFFLYIYWEGMHHAYASIPGLSNQGEELRAGTGRLSEAVSLQEW